MPEPRRFTHAARFAELYETAEGLIILEALVSIQGSKLLLSDLLVEPFEAPRAFVGPAEVLAIRRKLMEQARQEGYTVLELAGIRISGANPNRPFMLRRSI